MVPDGVTVISALHTVQRQAPRRRRALDEDILICGDRKADKARVARLIEQIDGLRAVNAGALEMARIVETLTPMLISINVRYKAHAGHQDHGPARRRPLGLIGSSAASSSPAAPAGRSWPPACRTCSAPASR